MLKEKNNEYIFNPIKDRSIVEQIVTTMSNLITEKKLMPGDRIPSEYELASSLQVSRNSVREALKILHAFGVVEIKVGDGTYISRGSKTSPLEVLGYCLMLDEFSHEKIYQLRQMLDIGLLNVIIDKVKDDELKMLEECIKEQERLLKTGDFDYKEYTQLDIEFHLKVASIAKNSLIEKVYTTMLNVFSASIERSVIYQRDRETSIEMHQAIVNVLRGRDRSRIIEVVQKSLHIWRESI